MRLLMIIFCVSVIKTTAQSCVCFVPELAYDFHRSAFIAQVRIDSIVENTPDEKFDKWLITTLHAFKGRSSTELFLRKQNATNPCGLQPVKGDTLLLAARAYGDYLVINPCSRMVDKRESDFESWQRTYDLLTETTSAEHLYFCEAALTYKSLNDYVGKLDVQDLPLGTPIALLMSRTEDGGVKSYKSLISISDEPAQKIAIELIKTDFSTCLEKSNLPMLFVWRVDRDSSGRKFLSRF